MSNDSLPICPQCGATLETSFTAGLCPNCLMALNLKTETVFSDATSAAQPPLPPERLAPHFPQLEILECLGRGGMGVVYKARQKTLNRFVALKLLALERVGDTQFAERFTREAQALAALNHPNIVTIHDFGQAGGFYFLLMEFVDGLNLRHLLRMRKLSPEESLTIVPPLCDALQFAHDRGIVHRDIKPEHRYQQVSEVKTCLDEIVAAPPGSNRSLPRQSKATEGEEALIEAQSHSNPQEIAKIKRNLNIVACLFIYQGLWNVVDMVSSGPGIISPMAFLLPITNSINNGINTSIFKRGESTNLQETGSQSNRSVHR
ncbi:MAG: serine/threonine-protein kinase [Verrucomicrobia bacterium]|nr:serine/threonine-protein kinase [Verrucomicrobiota bacterium]